VKYLLDTDAISEPARRRPSPAFMAHLRRHASDIAISSITVGEIVFGANRVPGGARYLTYLHEAVLPEVTVLGIDAVVATRYGEIRAALERAGTPLPDLDLLIAATALAHNLTLVTGNHRHFNRVPDLGIADWFGVRTR
jgi:predicted nucleic acid-binding protein